ncbi:MAG: hypothetical protein R2932_46245 [Caldilineaceae bacterium]
MAWEEQYVGQLVIAGDNGDLIDHEALIFQMSNSLINGQKIAESFLSTNLGGAVIAVVNACRPI